MGTGVGHSRVKRAVVWRVLLTKASYTPRFGPLAQSQTPLRQSVKHSLEKTRSEESTLHAFRIWYTVLGRLLPWGKVRLVELWK